MMKWCVGVAGEDLDRRVKSFTAQRAQTDLTISSTGVELGPCRRCVCVAPPVWNSLCFSWNHWCRIRGVFVFSARWVQIWRSFKLFYSASTRIVAATTDSVEICKRRAVYGCCVPMKSCLIHLGWVTGVNSTYQNVGLKVTTPDCYGCKVLHLNPSLILSRAFYKANHTHCATQFMQEFVETMLAK